MKSFSFKSLFPLVSEAEERFPDSRPATLPAVLSFLFKRSAKHLRTHLAARHGINLSHAQALDAVSASVGCADWNTAHGLLQRARVEEPPASAEPAMPRLDCPRPTPVQLSRHLDFSVSSLVIGPAGSGKTCGVLFAVQRARALERGRPVMVVRPRELPHYQPNWGNAVGHLPNVTTLETLDASRPGTPGDRLEVVPPDEFPDRDARARYQEQLVVAMLDWLERRAQLNPLVLVDEAPHALGEQARAFLEGLPETATIVWLTQSLSDFDDITPACSRFSRVYVMRSSRAEPRLTQVVGADQAKQASALIERLGVGEAVALPVMHRQA